MKKVFASVMAGLFLLTGVAFACDPSDPACYDATKYKTFANDFGNSGVGTIKGSSSTSWFGYGDDHAVANAQGGANAFYQGYAGGKGIFIGNTAGGAEDTESKSTAGTYAVDLGNTSLAGGFAAQQSAGSADAYALGGGLGKGTAWTKTDAGINGYVFQSNIAQEGNVFAPTGTWVVGQNSSEAGYQASAHDQNCNSGYLLWGSKSGVDLSGSAFTAGDTIVMRDSTGDFRSFYGKTNNVAMVDINGADQQNSAVFGFGSVQGRVGIGAPGDGGKAEGLSQFGYEGATFGKGGAEQSGYATQGSNYMSDWAKSGSSGKAYSISVGTPSTPSTPAN